MHPFTVGDCVPFGTLKGCLAKLVSRSSISRGSKQFPLDSTTARRMHADGNHPVRSMVLPNVQGGMLKALVSWIHAEIDPNFPDPETALPASGPKY